MLILDSTWGGKPAENPMAIGLLKIILGKNNGKCFHIYANKFTWICALSKN